MKCLNLWVAGRRAGCSTPLSIRSAHRAAGRRAIYSLAGCLILSQLLGGCTLKSRVLRQPVPGAVTDLGWTASGPDGVTLEVDRIIVRNTGGSWVRDANWDEYVLTVKNASAVPVRIGEFSLYSAKLPAPEKSTTSREQLEARSGTTLRDLRDAGIVAGAGAATAGVIVAIMGTGGTLVTGAAATAVVAGVFVFPVALVGSTVYLVERHHRDRNDRVLIEHKLLERGFSVLTELTPGVPVTRSAFFPITPAPSRLVLEYTAGGEARRLSLDLPDLAGLHLKAPRAPLRVIEHTT
jgi:hypothetical protein